MQKKLFWKVYSIYISNIKKFTIIQIYNLCFRCWLFLQTAAFEIQKRYDKDDIILSKLSTLKPKNAFSLEYREVQPSLIPLIKVIPSIVSNDETIQLIDDQWRRLPLLMSKIPEDFKSFLLMNFGNFCIWSLDIYLF